VAKNKTLLKVQVLSIVRSDAKGIKKSPAITAGLSLFNHFKDQRNKQTI
jgi:hypothetical protein